MLTMRSIRRALSSPDDLSLFTPSKPRSSLFPCVQWDFDPFRDSFQSNSRQIQEQMKELEAKFQKLRTFVTLPPNKHFSSFPVQEEDALAESVSVE